MIYLKKINLEGNKDRNDYPYNINLFKKGFNIKFKNNVTIIVGENGSGESTILRSIADNVGFNLDGGNINSSYNSYTKGFNIDVRMGWNIKTRKGFLL